MPSKSKAMQRASGMALAAKRGQVPKGHLRGAAKQMERSMSEGQLSDFASTKVKDLPEHVKPSHGGKAHGYGR